MEVSVTATPLRPAGTSISVLMGPSSARATARSTLIRSTLTTSTSCGSMSVMTRFVGAGEAARQLGVQRATLYAYVSRGLVERRVAVDGRTSLYAVDDLEALAGRARPRREAAARPSLDVQIVTAVTELDEAGPRYRGRDVAELARSVTYEQVAELLWSGSLPARADWPSPEERDRRLVRKAAAAVGGGGVRAIASAALALGQRHGGDDPRAAARRLLTALPDVVGPSGTVASTDPRLAAR